MVKCFPLKLFWLSAKTPSGAEIKSTLASFKRLELKVYLAYLLYGLTNWITLASAWCGAAAKMPGRTGLKGKKLEWYLPHAPLSQTLSMLLMLMARLYTGDGGNKKWWHLLTGSGDVRNSHVQTNTHTHTQQLFCLWCNHRVRKICEILQQTNAKWMRSFIK